MSRGIIFRSRILRTHTPGAHLHPATPSGDVVGERPPTFRAHVENGQLTLSARWPVKKPRLRPSPAQSSSKGLKLRVTDNLDILEDANPAAWETALPALLTHVALLHQHQATVSLAEQTVTVKGTVASGEAKTKLLHDGLPREFDPCAGSAHRGFAASTAPVALSCRPGCAHSPCLPRPDAGRTG